MEELAALAAEKTAQGGLRLMGEGGTLPEWLSTWFGDPFDV
ncbi:hypothetical protein ABZY09_35245 [Streptomyces sp. NPDC002928]